MEIKLLKTFLEVASSGSFVSAADQLFVTQSAVSFRVQRLEESLGLPLFKRSKAGAELTSAGREFESYAIGIIKIWEESRQQIAIPKGFRKSLTIGAQHSLWPRLGFRLVDNLRDAMPDLSIRQELGTADQLTRYLTEGVVQVGLLYSPQLRPGLNVTKACEDELVLVAPWENPTMDIAGRYIFVDWGPEFVQAHNVELKELTNPGLTSGLGAMTAEFIVRRDFAAYLPARYAKRYLDAKQLHLVPDAPRFPYPAWAVWRDDLDPEIGNVAKKCLSKTLVNIDLEQAKVLEQLRQISDKEILGTLGEITLEKI